MSVRPVGPRPRRRGADVPLLLGGTLVATLAALALISCVWTPYDPVSMDLTHRLAPPAPDHWLGTDRFGRDVASQILVGARTTLLVGVLAVGIAASVGVPLGVVAAMAPRRIGAPLMRALDVLLAFPALLLAIMAAAVHGAGTTTATLAIGIASVPGFARMARAGTLAVLRAEYVLAARAAGRGPWAIARHHVLPGIAGTIVVQASVAFSTAVLAEAALSYLGLGTPPPTPSWGRMLQENQDLLWSAPRYAIVPGAAIALAVLGFDLLGDALRDLLDPRLGERR